MSDRMDKSVTVRHAVPYINFPHEVFCKRKRLAPIIPIPVSEKLTRGWIVASVSHSFRTAHKHSTKQAPTLDLQCFTTSTSEASRPPSLTSMATIIAIVRPEYCQSRRRLFLPQQAAPRQRPRRTSFLSNSTLCSRALTRWDSPRFQSLGYLTGGLSLSRIRMCL